LRLEDGENGTELPAQFEALAKWPDGSIKVALVQFVGDLGEEKRLRLAYGTGVKRRAVSAGVAVSRAGGKTSISTGPIRVVINRQGVLDEVWRDGNANGEFEAKEQVFKVGEIYMVNAFDNQRYAARDGKADIVLEESGPVRAVVKAQGRFSDSRGRTHLRYLVRYFVSRGSDKVDIEMTLIDNRLDPDVDERSSKLAVALKDLGMRWQYKTDGDVTFRFGGETGKEYKGTVAGEHYLLQTGEFRYVDGVDEGHRFAYRGVGSGEKAPGWLGFSNGHWHTTLMLQDFWQQFPTELSLSNKMVTVGFFPARSIKGAADTERIEQRGKLYRRPNTLYFLRRGGAKTYRVRLAVDVGEPTTQQLQELNESYQRHELDLVATPAWYTSSGVWGELDVGGPGSSSEGYDAMLLHDIYEPSIERKDGNATMFGWRDYGDRLRARWATVKNGVKIPSFYDDTHVGSNNFFRQFLRTGEQRWYSLGEIATRHVMDIDVSHGPRQGYWKIGGRAQPAGELKCMTHENIDHETRNLHPGHAHVSGLSELYLITGDKRALEVLQEVGNWWKFMAPYLYKLPFDADERYREAERDFGWPLYVMSEYVRVTGDSAYHRDVAGRLVKYLIQWWQTPLPHIGYNPETGDLSNAVIGVNDAKAGTGYWTMTRMDNAGKVRRATGTNPWMAGALISNLIKFYEQDMQLAAVGKSSGISHAVLQDMLLQAQNYVVKYGYDQKNKRFVYSETQRDHGGGDHHILYGLAYLNRLFQRELAAGNLRHPEWYDTQPLWGKIAARRYHELRTTVPRRKTQSYGFYGYEIIYPLDFFKIMHDSLKQ
jgi:hypothetical protein